MRALNVETVVLTGGEPLMHTQLPELCEILKEAGLQVTVLTTGLLLPRFADTLLRLTDEVIVSVDGPPAIHDQVRRVPGAFALLSAGVKALHDRNPQFPVSGRCTVQKLNHSSLCATVNAAHSLGLRSISFLAADLTSTAFNRPSQLPALETARLELTLGEISALERELEELSLRYADDFATTYISESREKLRRIPLHFRARLGLAEAVAPRCNAPWVSAVIQTDGSLRPCFFHPVIGEAAAQGIRPALNSAAALDFRSRLDVPTDDICRRCVCSLWRALPT